MHLESTFHIFSRCPGVDEDAKYISQWDSYSYWSCYTWFVEYEFEHWCTCSTCLFNGNCSCLPAGIRCCIFQPSINDIHLPLKSFMQGHLSLNHFIIMTFAWHMTFLRLNLITIISLCSKIACTFLQSSIMWGHVTSMLPT